MRCPGFDRPCEAVLTPDTTWTVGSSQRREEWQACERCALEALRWTHAEVCDTTGEPVAEAP